VTFILNVLHKDMSILAADQKAIAEWPSIWGFPSQGKTVCHDYKKITMNSTGLLAIGMSGYSEHHSFIGEVERSESINDGLSIIRNHMEGFLLVDDRAALIKSASPFENECVTSFYDKDTQTFFTNEFRFNEFSNTTHLHRASDGVKLFCAGSGRNHFDLTSGRTEVQSLVATNESLHMPGVVISWMKAVFRKVSAQNEGCGAEAIFAVSTRTNQEFRLSERC
jgi:hypothetical protein